VCMFGLKCFMSCHKRVQSGVYIWGKLRRKQLLVSFCTIFIAPLVCSCMMLEVWLRKGIPASLRAYNCTFEKFNCWSICDNARSGSHRACLEMIRHRLPQSFSPMTCLLPQTFLTLLFVFLAPNNLFGILSMRISSTPSGISASSSSNTCLQISRISWSCSSLKRVPAYMGVLAIYSVL
jgi:hypothetical protein